MTTAYDKEELKDIKTFIYDYIYWSKASDVLEFFYNNGEEMK